MKTLTLFAAILGLLISCKNMVETTGDETAVQPYLDSLDIQFQELFGRGQLPGFALAIFTPDSILFQKGYGFADKEKKLAYSPGTVQCIASVSKTLIAVCLMKAVEEGKLSLDDHINDILPFKVINPYYPDDPITVRQLATHTSGVSDKANYDRAYIFSSPLDPADFPEPWAPHIDVFNRNTAMSMETYFRELFTPDGKWNSEDNFLDQKPGTHYEYSNIGAGLLAFTIEAATGEDYRAYSRKQILGPLQMAGSGWSRKEVDTINHIAYYNESYNRVPPYYNLTYPDGSFLSTVADMTRFLQEMMKGYAGDGHLLTNASFKEMMRNQTDTLDTPAGLIWDLENECCIGHGGNDFGVSTMMFFDPGNNLGKILFSNISIEKEEQADAFYSVFNTMFRYDDKLAGKTETDMVQ